MGLEDIQRSLIDHEKSKRQMERQIGQQMADMAASVAARHQRHDMAVELALANTASEFCERLVKRIVEFEGALDEKEEVGVRLVSFGQSVTMHVRNLSYHNPSLIIFQGLTEDQKPLELIQHVTQISFLLMAVKRLDESESRSEFGFHTLFNEIRQREEESTDTAES